MNQHANPLYRLFSRTIEDSFVRSGLPEFNAEIERWLLEQHALGKVWYAHGETKITPLAVGGQANSRGGWYVVSQAFLYSVEGTKPDAG